VINIISWILGTIFILFTIGFFGDGAIIAGLIGVVAICQTLPVTYKLIHKKTMAAAKEKGIEEKPLKQSAGLTIGLFLFVISLVAFGFSIDSNKPKTESEIIAERKEECEDTITPMFYVQKAVKQNLKSPATAEFPFYDDSQIQHIGDCVYQVRSYVDSQNSFGATIRTSFYVRIKRGETENDWQIQNIELH
tara:strand:+ start:217 stop:792 length:576 start_codon:yes stop_codon:yes gene_type:complete